MKRMIRSASVPGITKLTGIVTWNNSWYGYVPGRVNRYYKSHTARFDDSMGGTEEISSAEYYTVAEKYAKVFRD